MGAGPDGTGRAVYSRKTTVSIIQLSQNTLSKLFSYTMTLLLRKNSPLVSFMWGNSK